MAAAKNRRRCVRARMPPRGVPPPPVARSAAMSRGAPSFAPSQHPGHEQKIKPVSEEADRRHGQNAGEHRIVDTALAEKGDEVTEAATSHEELGRDQENEGQR